MYFVGRILSLRAFISDDNEKVFRPFIFKPVDWFIGDNYPIRLKLFFLLPMNWLSARLESTGL